MTNSPPVVAAPDLHCSRQGDCALLCVPMGSDVLSLSVQRRIWALARALAEEAGVEEVVPGMGNFLVIFRQTIVDIERVQATLAAQWQALQVPESAGRLIEIPVVYGGPRAQDLAYVATHCGVSPYDYISRHAEGRYTVYALGSQPGFAYLAGLDPSLSVPRRAVPRPRVESGSVIIGGAQAGVLSKTTPSGWHIIGHTPLRFFDPLSDPPVTLLPGDTVRFRVQEVLA